MEVNNTLRVKMEDDGHPEMLAKLQRPGQDERELRDHNERLQHETAAVIKRQAREADSFMRVRTTPTSLVTSSASNLSSPPPAFPVFIPQLHNRLLPTTTTPCSSPGSSTSQSSPSSSVNNIAASTDRETPGQDPSKYSSEELFRQKSFNGGTSGSRSDKEKNSEALGVASLYELNDDPQRKEFLDDLFQFMQKRGSTVLFNDQYGDPFTSGTALCLRLEQKLEVVTSTDIVDIYVTLTDIVDSNVTLLGVVDIYVTLSDIVDGNVTLLGVVDIYVTLTDIVDSNVTSTDTVDFYVTSKDIVDSNVTLLGVVDIYVILPDIVDIYAILSPACVEIFTSCAM
ncbi:uncharacterized protein LOC143245456 [Tachypleus tridentatus]|uniref:uncharacterized protein LOC143245456 n=1 Tax=Tachypleus tridentatus TaxID=6853 RepID=UPI003FD5A0F2